ncbi:GPW/gp25 family protein [Marimonas arenosa]|uniref:GPW/gp25 family protein n=1 Tax=Marimonas arenosa TaxID=1795305 RepID=A0AAE3WA37_9RHOB|nr:GPW/gp25 family protein [Marimonas arenosa]MDQ2088740.1 GPW/gp25 family protein [Marimonas arenosa]
MDRSFLGRGWSFPPVFHDQGRSLAMVEGEEDIRQSLLLLLHTTLGERVMRPTFGWRRDTLVFEPLSTTMAAVLRREIEGAVLFFEPRIKLDTVRFERLASMEGVIEMRLDYTVRATNTRNNLVLPFYLEEATNA